MICLTRYYITPSNCKHEIKTNYLFSHKVHSYATYSSIGNMAYALIFLNLIVLILILFYFLLKSNKQYWKRLNVFGPEPHLLFGHYKEFILRRTTVFELQQKIYNAYPTEKFVGLYHYTTPVLFLRDLDLIQHVFISGFDSFVNRGVEFGGKLSINLASTSDEKWRLLRIRLSPIFTSGKLKNMLHLVERCGDQLLEYLNNEFSSSFECDIERIIRRYSAASIAACAFGVDMDIDCDDKKLVKVEKMLFTQYQFGDLFYLCPSLLNKTGFATLPNAISEYFCDLVEVIKKQRKGVPSNRKDFMDLLLEMKIMTELKGGQKYEGDEEKVLPITDELIAAQAMIFYAAGFETSATTLSFLLYELARHPNIQEKIVEEIKHVLYQNNEELSLETLKQLTYMGQAIDETLRMYSILDLQRKVSAPSCTIPGTCITLKRGDYVFVPTRGIHYDEKYYPEPYKFDPDRFSPENVKSRHPCAFMPFGLGPRQCIGMRFAKVQTKIFLVKFLRQYRVEPVDGLKGLTYDPMRVTLAAKNGVHLKVVRRCK